eukprot:201200-Rhodomonas_salina.4
MLAQWRGACRFECVKARARISVKLAEVQIASAQGTIAHSRRKELHSWYNLQQRSGTLPFNSARLSCPGPSWSHSQRSTRLGAKSYDPGPARPGSCQWSLSVVSLGEGVAVYLPKVTARSSPSLRVAGSLGNSFIQ